MATATQALPPAQGSPKIGTGLSDSTHSSSASADRYGLNENDTHPQLVYRYRGRVDMCSQKDLTAELDKNESLRVTTVPIPKYASWVEVRRHDLFLDEEKKRYRSEANYFSSLASVKVPTMAWFSRIFLGTYTDLYIVSLESSPTSSLADKDSLNGRQTPASGSGWGNDSEEEAKLGDTD